MGREIVPFMPPVDLYLYDLGEPLNILSLGQTTKNNRNKGCDAKSVLTRTKVATARGGSLKGRATAATVIVALRVALGECSLLAIKL